MFWPARAAGQRRSSPTRTGIDTSPARRRPERAHHDLPRALGATPRGGRRTCSRRRPQGGTTSEATPTVGGVIALVLSYGKQAAAAGPDRPAAQPEPRRSRWCARRPRTSTRTRTRRTAGRRSPAGTSSSATGARTCSRRWRRSPPATSRPSAGSTRPRWYSLYDPTETLEGAGHRPRRGAALAGLHAGRSSSRPGAEPDGRASSSAPATGSGPRPFDGRARRRRPDAGPEVVLERGVRRSRETKTLETNEQYTVTLRLRVTDAAGPCRRGAPRDRRPPRPVAARRASRAASGPAARAQPQLADLQGTRQARDRLRRRRRPRARDRRPTRPELPRLPGRAPKPTVVERAPRGRRPRPRADRRQRRGRRPRRQRARCRWSSPRRTGRVYVWNARGDRRRAGRGRSTPASSSRPIPRPDAAVHAPADAGRVRAAGARRPRRRPRARDRSRPAGTAASTPGTANGAHAAGLARQGDAARRRRAARRAWSRSTTSKLDLPPALAELDGDPQPELVARSQYSIRQGAGLQVPNGGVSNVLAYNDDGTPRARLAISSTGAGLLLRLRPGVHHRGRRTSPSRPTSTATGATRSPAPPDLLADLPARRRRLASAGLRPGARRADLDLPPTRDALSTPERRPARRRAGQLHHLGRLRALRRRRQLTYAEPGSGAASVAGALLLTGSGPADQQLHARLRRADAAPASRASPPRARGSTSSAAPADRRRDRRRRAPR